MNKKIKTIFAGTPHFSVPSFLALADHPDFCVLAAITQPDKPMGRSGHTSPHPVKIAAQKKNIPIWQPAKINDVIKNIKEINPDIMVVAAYSQLIPKDILNIPKYGCFNLHASLLPKYRGSSCIQAPILNGDSSTGVTVIKMEEKLDAGPIVAKKEIKIESNDTSGSLFDKLSVLGGEILPETIINYIDGKIQIQHQNNEEAVFVSRIKKEDGEINWQDSAEKIERLVRAMHPWPGTFTNLGEEKKYFKILEVEVLASENYHPGDIFLANGWPAIQCGQKALIIKKIQPEGGRIMSGCEFLNGYSRLFTKN